VSSTRNAHRLPEKEIVKIFESGLKPEIFHEEICSRSFESLVNVMDETRHELSSCRDIIEISQRIKRPKVKKNSKDKNPKAHVPRKSGSTPRPDGRMFQVSQEMTLCKQMPRCKGEG